MAITAMTTCGCSQANAPSGLGFTPAQPAPQPQPGGAAGGIGIDWKILALIGIAALIVLWLFKQSPKRQARSAARDRYRRALERIDRQYA